MFGTSTNVRPRLHQRHELVVDVAVAHAVREGVDAGLQQPLRVLEREDVRGDAELVLVRFVDDGAVELGRQLLELAVAIVDPDLDDVDLLRGVLLHGLARPRPRVVIQYGAVGAARLRRRDAAAGREEARRARDRLRALIWNGASPVSCPRLSAALTPK